MPSGRKIALAAAVLVAAVVFFLLATLPPAPRRAAWGGDPSIPARTIAGAYHVHTTRSDGTEDRAGVAAAAARAGLQFVIFTDHGDGTREPEPPAYLSGVLCLDGVEISTNGGHYVALGLPKAPYPLGGEPFAVVEDVARLGGFGIAAHVDSPKPSLAWTDWEVPIDGIEWLNADSEWRDEPQSKLTRALFDYFVRPGPALASLLDRPSDALRRWDALAGRRPVVALAGHDAHGGFGGGVEDAGGRRVPLPSYEASFRSFSTRVVLDRPLSNDAADDGRRLLAAIRAGRVFTATDAVAAPAFVDVRGWQGEGSDQAKSEMGSVLRAGRGGVSIRVPSVAGAELVLISETGEVTAGRRSDYVTDLDGFSGAVRFEVRVAGAPGVPPVPWLVTNPIYFLPPQPAPPADAAPASAVPFPADVDWHAEHDPSSVGAVTAPPDGATRPAGRVLSYRLGPAPKASQFAALVADMPGRIPAFERLLLEGRASQPMRVSVQLRYGSGAGGRWGRSVYLGEHLRRIDVALGDLLPLDGQTGPAPDPASARSLLFVVDLTNATPGTSGSFEVLDLRFVR